MSGNRDADDGPVGFTTVGALACDASFTAVGFTAGVHRCSGRQRSGRQRSGLQRSGLQRSGVVTLAIVTPGTLKANAVGESDRPRA